MTRRLAWGFAFTALVSILLPAGDTAPVAAWQNTQRPTFRAGTVLVPVDVRVVDGQGKPVTDLKQTDFTILEDNQPQTVSHFSYQTFRADASAGSTKLSPRQSVATDLAAPTRRVFLIMFGRGHLQKPSNGIDAMVSLVHSSLLPQDLVAVYYLDRATDFTTDHAAIEALIERFKIGYESIESQLVSLVSQPGSVYGSAGVPPKVQAQIDAIFAGAPGVREVPPSAGRENNAIARDVGDQLNGMTQSDLLAGLGDFASDNRQTMQDAGSLYTGIDYLRRLDGEKHLIFLAEQGPNLPRADNDRSLAAEASDARVVIDTIQTGGLSGNAAPPGGGAARAPGQGGGGGGGGGGAGAAGGAGGSRVGRGQGRTPPRGGGGGAARPASPNPQQTNLAQMYRGQALLTYAEFTGGVSSLHAMASDGVNRIIDANSSSYLLGYYPTNTALNAKYRRIEIKVNRPDLTVYYRHGYYAQDAVTPFDRQDMITKSRMQRAADFDKEITDIGLHVAAAFTGGDGGAGQVGFQVTVDPSKLVFTQANGRHSDTLQVAVACFDRNKQPVGSTQEALNLNLTDASFEQAKAKGIAYNPKVAVSAKPDSAKIVVYDYAADLVGTAIVKIH
jgi:VWFA-related protein